MPSVSAAQENGSDVDALRGWTTFDAELKTFTSSSLLGDFTRQFGGERQISTDLANN
jgi:hypothetical protein